MLLKSGEERVVTIPAELLDRVQRLRRSDSKATEAGFRECRRSNSTLPKYDPTDPEKKSRAAYCFFVKKAFKANASNIKRTMVIQPTRHKQEGKEIEFKVTNTKGGDKDVVGRVFTKETEFIKQHIKDNGLEKVSCNKGCADIARA